MAVLSMSAIQHACTVNSRVGTMRPGPEGLQRYIDDIRQGKGQSAKQYSARYICSLVADFHRCAPQADS